MTDPSELRALQASLRGALGASEALTALRDRVEALQPEPDIPDDLLEELARVTLANAVASAALRALVETMRQRRERA